jgi:hypothetical protein
MEMDLLAEGLRVKIVRPSDMLKVLRDASDVFSGKNTKSSESESPLGIRKY